MSTVQPSWALDVLQRAISSAGRGKILLRREEAQLIAKALGEQEGHSCLVQDDGDPCFCGGAASCPNRMAPRAAHPAFTPR